MKRHILNLGIVFVLVLAMVLILVYGHGNAQFFPVSYYYTNPLYYSNYGYFDSSVSAQSFGINSFQAYLLDSRLANNMDFGLYNFFGLLDTPSSFNNLVSSFNMPILSDLDSSHMQITESPFSGSAYQQKKFSVKPASQRHIEYQFLKDSPVSPVQPDIYMGYGASTFPVSMAVFGGIPGAGGVSGVGGVYSVGGVAGVPTAGVMSSLGVPTWLQTGIGAPLW